MANIIEQVAANMSGYKSPVEGFLRGQALALDEAKGIQDLVYKRSLNARAKIDNAAAAAELADYTANRQARQGVEQAKLELEHVDSLVQQGDVDEALTMAKQYGVAPKNAVVEYKESGGVRIPFVVDYTTGEEEPLGASARTAWNKLEVARIANAEKFRRDLALTEARKTSTSSSSRSARPPIVKKEDREAASTVLATALPDLYKDAVGGISKAATKYSEILGLVLSEAKRIAAPGEQLSVDVYERALTRLQSNPKFKHLFEEQEPEPGLLQKVASFVGLGDDDEDTTADDEPLWRPKYGD